MAAWFVAAWASMRDQPEDSETQVGGGDLEYDEAHDLPPQREQRSAAGHHGAAVHVSTTTDDDGQDYGYDLAHDIPPARRD
jgi:hypothetical protein